MNEWFERFVVGAAAGAVFAVILAVGRGIYLAIQRSHHRRRLLELSTALVEVHEVRGIDGVIKALASVGFAHEEQEEDGEPVHVFKHKDGTKVIRFHET